MVQLNSKKYFVENSTQFTKEFLADQFNFDFQDAQGEPTQDDWVAPLPPQNGFGDELDSQQNCKKLIPQPPKKDIFKYLDNTAEQRFKARSVENNGDVLEQIIRWYDCDDTLDIQRVELKNNGYVNRGFLTRGKYNITLHELFSNEQVVINHREYTIFEVDQKSRNLYEKL